VYFMRSVCVFSVLWCYDAKERKKFENKVSSFAILVIFLLFGQLLAVCRALTHFSNNFDNVNKQTETLFSLYFQVANYGIGGQYGTHMDTTGYWTVEGTNHNKRFDGTRVFYEATGDRMGTFMAYLSDVQSGGNTAFPLLGVSVKPIRGDGVFWINMKSDGISDKLTSHAGCPVLVGSKWITNKWISYLDQYEKFKCGLFKPKESFKTQQLFRNQNIAVGNYWLKY
jgi:hypothetical protein